MKSPREEPPRGAASREGRITTIPSTDVQNALGGVLQRVRSGERVVITRYGRREAVILSTEDYADLVGEEPVDLAALEEEFDAMMEQMQTAEHTIAVERLFRMSDEELGEAAVAQAVATRAKRTEET